MFVYGLERKERRFNEFTRNNSEVLGSSNSSSSNSSSKSQA